MARSGWCLEKTKHTEPLEACKWDKCDCRCHNPTGLIKPTKRKPTKRKGKY
jgi:hypothetical protein